MGKSSSPKSKSGKSSGGKDGGGEPPVETGIQTEPDSFCYLCCVDFSDGAAVQAHTLLMDHEAPYDISHQHCRKCKDTVFMKWSEKHKCCLAKSAFLRYISSNVSLGGGPPYRCLFCRSRPLKSRSELTVHLLAYHRPQRQPGVCGLCTFTFQEPPQLPPPIPPPPANADEATLRQYDINLKKALGEQMCRFEAAEVAPGLMELDKHCAKTHVPAYTLLLRRELLTQFQLREPFACVICGQVFHSNIEYHAHILCRHGTDAPVKEGLRICAMCSKGVWSEDCFNQHVKRRHEEAIAQMADLWTSQELLMDATDTNQVCTTCWEVLPNPTQLQAHILVAHTTDNPLVCGWCHVEFTDCPDPLIAFPILLNHEKNHARILHRQALESKKTFEPIPEPLNEDFSMEAIAVETTETKVDTSKSSKSKSSSKKKK
nr:unnamed protein product [Spirometra erinaceieuropaei]